MMWISTPEELGMSSLNAGAHRTGKTFMQPTAKFYVTLRGRFRDHAVLPRPRWCQWKEENWLFRSRIACFQPNGRAVNPRHKKKKKSDTIGRVAVHLCGFTIWLSHSSLLSQDDSLCPMSSSLAKKKRTWRCSRTIIGVNRTKRENISRPEGFFSHHSLHFVFTESLQKLHERGVKYKSCGEKGKSETF